MGKRDQMTEKRYIRVLAYGVGRGMIGFALACLTAIAPSRADDWPLKVILPTWGPTIQADGTGMFVDLFRFALEGHEDKYQIEYVSYDKALKLLLYSEAHCAYPIARRTLRVSVRHLNSDGLVESHPILISKTFLFSRPNDKLISSVRQMRGKLLIQIRGENYNHNFKTSGARFWNVDSEPEKIRVLLSGRGDALLGSMPDILFSFDDLGQGILPFDPDFPVLEYDNAMTCKATDTARKLVDIFNRRVESTLKDGSLKAFTIESGVPEILVDTFLPTLDD